MASTFHSPFHSPSPLSYSLLPLPPTSAQSPSSRRCLSSSSRGCCLAAGVPGGRLFQTCLAPTRRPARHPLVTWACGARSGVRCLSSHRRWRGHLRRVCRVSPLRPCHHHSRHHQTGWCALGCRVGAGGDGKLACLDLPVGFCLWVETCSCLSVSTVALAV